MTATTIEETLAHLQSRGLRSVADVRALIHLAGVPHATATNLSNAAGVCPAAGTGMIDRLDRAKMIRRLLTDADRRLILVAITPAGRATIDPFLP